MHNSCCTKKTKGVKISGTAVQCMQQACFVYIIFIGLWSSPYPNTSHQTTQLKFLYRFCSAELWQPQRLSLAVPVPCVTGRAANSSPQPSIWHLHAFSDITDLPCAELDNSFYYICAILAFNSTTQPLFSLKILLIMALFVIHNEV